MRMRHVLGVLAVLVLATNRGGAFGGRWSAVPAFPAASHFVPTHVAYAVPWYSYPYYLPVPSCSVAIPVVAPVSRPLAAPSRQEPPLSRAQPKAKGPIITESRSPGGMVPAVAADRCKVGFWNVTGKEVTLKVAGKEYRLAKDRALTLDLEREFAWQVGGGAPQAVKVQADQAFHEVILRQRLQ